MDRRVAGGRLIDECGTTTMNGLLGTRQNQTVNNKYRLLRKLGEGGMGEVYQATHIGIGRPFALKFLHAHLARSEEFVDRFQREAQSAGSLVDENIVSVTDFGVAEDGAPYLVMEYLEGESLSELLIRHGSLPIPHAVLLVIQTCRGLANAHAKGIIHRDLKPENLFVCRRNDGSDLVKILDFGIAKLRTATGITRTGISIGTPFYMSPEQARGAKDIDHRTDIYALGAILYEMLSGRKPHGGGEFLSIVHHVLNEKVLPLKQLCAGIPVGMCSLIDKAMAFEANDRFDTVVHLMEALIPYAGRAITPLRSELVAAVQERTRRLPVSSTDLEAAVVEREPRRRAAATTRRVGRSPRLWVSLAVVGLLVLVGIAWLAMHHRPEQERERAAESSPVPPPVPSLAPSPAPPPPAPSLAPLPAPPPAPSLAPSPAPSPATSVVLAGSAPAHPREAPAAGKLAEAAAVEPAEEAEAVPTASRKQKPAEQAEAKAAPTAAVNQEQEPAPRQPQPMRPGERRRETGPDRAPSDRVSKAAPHRLVRPLDERNPFRSNARASTRRSENAP